MRETPTNPGRIRGKVASTGFVTLPVDTLSSAIEAWRLTYNWLRRTELIPPNKHRIHTHPQAATEHALVVGGWIGSLAVSTLTAISDSDRGLPLDRCFPDVLNKLRHDGRRIIEVSLFGDRRNEMSRTTDSLLWLMRLVWSWGRIQKADDFLIAVAPSLRKYYQNGFGFKAIGDPRPYAAVGGRLAQLMRCDVVHWRKEKVIPPAVQFLSSHPADEATFKDRYLFPSREVSQSPISEFLLQQQQQTDTAA